MTAGGATLYNRLSAGFISHIRMLPSPSMFQHQRMNVRVLGSVKKDNMLRKLRSPLVSDNYILTGFRQSHELRQIRVFPCTWL